MHLDTALLLARLRMSPYAFEDKVGEKRYGRGINNLKPRQPFGSLPFPAVRGKFILVCGIQIPIGSLEDTLRPSCVGIGKSAATGHHANAQMRKLAGFGEHGVSYLTQGVKAFDHSIEHDD